MNDSASILCRIGLVTLALIAVLAIVMFAGITLGPAGNGMTYLIGRLSGSAATDTTLQTIIFQLRLPRVIIAALAGGTLGLGGLVFQALLRNPLAEPYILGISGGSAIGAILGMLCGFARFPGVGLSAFAGSMLTLMGLMALTSGRSFLKKDGMLLAGVMVNAFCSAVILFLVTLLKNTELHSVLFWLMGDISAPDMQQAFLMLLLLAPCWLLVFLLSYVMNVLLLGKELAHSMGINIRVMTTTLLIVTTFMVSTTVCQCGLLGFVGLVIPHIMRLLLGADHRVLVPACLLGGGTFLVLCDMLARILPQQGELPVGVITAMIGAPIFIILLRRSRQ